MEVVVSMVILSVVLSAVATLVVTSVQHVARSDAGITAATIAQDSMERLLTAPVSRWAFESNGKVKRNIVENKRWGDGRDYRIERIIEPTTSGYELRDACDTVVGANTSASDLIKVTINVTPLNNKGRDKYSTSFLLSRDDDSVISESSLTVKFNVYNGIHRAQYKESASGGIRVVIGKGTAHEQSGITRNGCVTFLGINEDKVAINFTTKGFTETLSQSHDYEGSVTLVKGGNRLVEYDLTPRRQVMVVPKINGNNRVDCSKPKLMRMRTQFWPVARPGIRPLADLANEGEEIRQRLANAPYWDRRRGDQVFLDTAKKWQYFMKCEPLYARTGEQHHFNYLLPDNIPISLIEETGSKRTIRPITTWADSDFKPTKGEPALEEADWPVIELPKARRGVIQRLLVGSCIMSGSDTNRAIVTIEGNTQANWKPSLPSVIRLPLWSIALDGVDHPHHLRDVWGSYPVTIKNIYDNGDPSRFGDHLVRNTYQQHYSGCTDTPVFFLGWLEAYKPHRGLEQLLVALPYGLYAYDFYSPYETETNEAGDTVMRSRHTCSSTCRHARGEKPCISAGIDDVALYDHDGEYLRDRYNMGYLDWEQRIRLSSNGSSTVGRGPILEACARW